VELGWVRSKESAVELSHVALVALFGSSRRWTWSMPRPQRGRWWLNDSRRGGRGAWVQVERN
jgi:hypothetical protein